MNAIPGSYKAHTPRTTRPAVLAIAAVLALTPIALDDALVEPARAQLGGCGVLGFGDCAFDIELTDWNGTGAPGSTLNGTLTIENTGDGPDSYEIIIETDNENWTAGTDPEETEEVEDGDNITVTINVLVPEDAHLDENTTITLTVRSQTDEEVEESITFEAVAGQFHAWTFVCAPEITLAMNHEAAISLSATNTGNGPDEAIIRHTPMPGGFEIEEPATVAVESGQTQEQNVTLRVDAGPDDYEIQWTLQSLGDTNVTEPCTTRVTVVENGPVDNDEDVDTPGPALVIILGAILLALVAHRRERHA